MIGVTLLNTISRPSWANNRWSYPDTTALILDQIVELLSYEIDATGFCWFSLGVSVSHAPSTYNH